MLVSEAFELYRVEHIVYLNQSQRTEEMSANACKTLLRFIGKDIQVSELTFEIIRKWKEDLEKTHSQNTVRGYILKLKVVVKHLNHREVPGVINHEMIGLPKRKQVVVEFLTEKEVCLMLQYCRKSRRCIGNNALRNQAIIALLYASGIRLSELIAMNIGDIRDDGTFTVVGKGDKPRLCFSDQRSRRLIDKYIEVRTDDCKALFISEQTLDRISKSTMQYMIRNVARSAGIEKRVHPHIMRHSFATNLLRNNTNLLYVKQFLGHESVQTTEMYTHVVDEDLRRVYCKFHTI